MDPEHVKRKLDDPSFRPGTLERLTVSALKDEGTVYGFRVVYDHPSDAQRKALKELFALHGLVVTEATASGGRHDWDYVLTVEFAADGAKPSRMWKNDLP